MSQADNYLSSGKNLLGVQFNMKPIKIDCFEALREYKDYRDLVFDIDLSEKKSEKYSVQARDRVKFIELHNATIDHKLEFLIHPLDFIACRDNENILKLCKYINHGATVLFGLSIDNPLNTLYCLQLLSVLPIYSNHNSARYDQYDECRLCELSLRESSLKIPCLIGWKSQRGNEELQWSLRWRPNVDDLNRSCQDIRGMEQCLNCWPQADTTKYHVIRDRDSMFILTDTDRGAFRNAIPQNLDILKRETGAFISAFAYKYGEGRVIVAPDYCKDEVLVEFEKKGITQLHQEDHDGNMKEENNIALDDKVPTGLPSTQDSLEDDPDITIKVIEKKGKGFVISSSASDSKDPHSVTYSVLCRLLALKRASHIGKGLTFVEQLDEEKNNLFNKTNLPYIYVDNGGDEKQRKVSELKKLFPSQVNVSDSLRQCILIMLFGKNNKKGKKLSEKEFSILRKIFVPQKQPENKGFKYFNIFLEDIIIEPNSPDLDGDKEIKAILNWS